MLRRTKNRRHAVLLILLCPALGAIAQERASVPLSDAGYTTLDRLPPEESAEARLAAYEEALAALDTATKAEADRWQRFALVQVATDLASVAGAEKALEAAHRLSRNQPSAELYERLGTGLLSAARRARFADEPEGALARLETARLAFSLADDAPVLLRDAEPPAEDPRLLHRAMVGLEELLAEDSRRAWAESTGLLERFLETSSEGPLATWARRMLENPESYVPAPEPGLDQVVHVAGAIQPPSKVFNPAPSYTEEARKARIQGVVILQCVIDEHGHVVALRPLKGLPMGLTDEAIRTVATWFFEPATLDGRPVAVYFNLTVNFRLA